MNHEQTETLAAGLNVLRALQRVSMSKLGHDRADKEIYQIYGLALSIEVSEFVNELNWKPWKHTQPNKEAVLEEFVDVLHFIGTWTQLLLHLGFNTADIATAFASKYNVNQERLDGKVEGYGVREWNPLQIPD